MFLYRRKRTYWIGYKENGKRKQRPLHRYLDLSFPVTTTDEAYALFAKIRQAEMDSALGIPQESKVPVPYFYHEYQKDCDRNKTLKTVRADNYRLKRWLFFLEDQRLEWIGQITKSVLNNFAQQLKYSNATINRYVSLIRASLRWGVRQGLLKENPVKDFPRFKENRQIRSAAFKEGDLEKLFSIPDQDFVFYLKLVYFTLLRRSEALSLTWQDISLTREEIVVRDTKTQIPRTIPISEELLPLIRDFATNGVAPATKRVAIQNGNLFPNWKEDSVTQKFRRIRDNLKLSIRGIHDFRHLRASELLRAGANPRAVQELLGHKTSKMTMEVYAHVNIDGLREAVEM